MSATAGAWPWCNPPPAHRTWPVQLITEPGNLPILQPAALRRCALRFGGTVVAGILGLGALYFSVLCNGLSFENRPPKVRAGAVRCRTVVP